MMGAERRCELHPGDAGYPERLLELEHPPNTLYVRGNTEILKGPSLSIVGSRDATPYGLSIAECAARLAVDAGITVVSGGAMGCDCAAGCAALDAGGGNIVVLGTGADVVYPRSSKDMIERTISKNGAVISIERWGSPPRRYAFPKRNKVIAALSLATLVTEAGMPSGTFSTAETASQLGREVLAIPGSIYSPESRGANYLLTVGATCVADFDSLDLAISRIFGTMRYCTSDTRCTEAAGGGIEQRVLRALVANPMRLDEVSAALSIPMSEVIAILGELNLKGLVTTLFDGRFAPSKNALHASTPLGHNG